MVARCARCTPLRALGMLRFLLRHGGGRVVDGSCVAELEADVVRLPSRQLAYCFSHCWQRSHAGGIRSDTILCRRTEPAIIFVKVGGPQWRRVRSGVFDIIQLCVHASSLEVAAYVPIDPNRFADCHETTGSVPERLLRLMRAATVSNKIQSVGSGRVAPCRFRHVLSGCAC